MGLEKLNSPSCKVKFEKDPVMDPFVLKCRQAFNGPQEFEIDGKLEFKYNEINMRGSMTFQYNHIVDNLKQELSISFPYIESFTLVEPNLLEEMCGALIVILTQKCASKLLPTFGTREFIAEKMKHETDFSPTLNKFMFVLEPFFDTEQFFEGNSSDEKPIYYPFSDLENRFDWVVKTRSLDNKRGINNANLNIFERCTSEGFSKYLERNLLKIIPYDRASGANYVYQQPQKKVAEICLHPKDEHYKTQRRLKHSNDEHSDENVFYERSENGVANDYMHDDFKRKVAFYKRHVGFEDSGSNENFLDSMRVSVTPTVRNHGHDSQKALQLNITSSASMPSAESSKKSVRRKILTISLSDDEGEEEENSSSSNCSVEPPEKKMKFTGNTSLFRFPPQGNNFVEVQFDDVRVLAHGEMLNDTIVEFYIRYIVHRLLKKTDMNKIHIFNTFFFQKLTDRHPLHAFGKSERASSQRFAWIKNNYKLVKSWTKKANIFEKDYIIVPVNDDLHWYVVIIVKPALAVMDSEDDTSESRKRGASVANPATHLVVLDSLRDSADNKRRCVVDIIRDYLECELEDKKTVPGHFHRRMLGVVNPLGLPRQQNYVDCGLYLLGFVEAFMTNPVPTEVLNSENLSWYNWYPHFNVKMKFMREKILRFIFKLAGVEKVANLKAYEKSQGRGATVPTIEGIVDEGRRPRRHTITGYFETIKHSSFNLRCPSEPPDLRNFPPPAGISVVKN